MKKYRLIDNDELVALPEDLRSLIHVVDELPTPSKDNFGQSFFLRESCKVGDRIYLKGYVYKCVSHYEVDPSTGIKVIVYSWEIATFSEAGALDKVSDVNITIDSYSGYTTLYWTDPKDKKYRDAADSATWAYTVVVRKFVPSGGDPDAYQPKTIHDGEIVAMSGVRDHYTAEDPLFDTYPRGMNYSYNIFAVTKYGVATGLDAEGSKTLTWEDVRDIIRAGKGGTIFAVGDCVEIEHGLLGTLDLQVVHMGTNIPVYQGDTVVQKPGVIFMSRHCLPKCTYDAKEQHSIINELRQTVVNPADNISEADKTYWASERGRADWVSSNLRQFLNKHTRFTVSEDVKWDLNKYYFILEEGNYIQVPIPPWPDRVNPKELGYFEAFYEFEPTHPHDLPAGAGEQVCVYGKREMPGFYDFLEAEFRNVLADAAVTTLGSDLTHPGSTPRYPPVVTKDKIFIPSYYELFGKNSAVFFTVPEGLFWTYFNPEIEIPELGETRSHVKYDVNGQLSGYYTRSLGMIEISPNVYSVIGDSSVWSVKSRGFTEPPPLGTEVVSTAPCSMSKVAADKTDVNGIQTAPGVAWCCIVA